MRCRLPGLGALRARGRRARRPTPRPRVGAVAAAMLLVAIAASPASADERQGAIVRLTVNEVTQGDVQVVLRDGDVLVRAADLERAGVGRLGARREPIAGEDHVSLMSLAPDAAWSFDEPNLAVKLITQAPTPTTRVEDFSPGRPPGIVYSQAPAAFLNTSVSGLDWSGFAWSGEAGISARHMLLFSSASRDAQGRTTRGLSNFTYDDPERMMRLLVGDRFDTTGVLGGSTQLGGLSFSREFSLDPYFVRFPTIGLSGAVLTRSTAEIYVNGQLVRREDVPAGPFELRNLPVPLGVGTAQIVLRDAFGRVDVIAQPYYFTSAVLKEGVSEWSYDLGFRRDQNAGGLGEYGPLNFLARQRLGITDNVTAGYRLELGTDLASGGPSLTLRTPVGDVELAAAGSVADRGASGWAASLGYNLATPWLSLGVAAQTMSDEYSTVSLKVPADRPRLNLLALLSFPITSRATATLSYSRADYRDAGERERISASANVRISNRVSLFATASRSEQRGQPGTLDLFGGLTYYLGDYTTATLSHSYTRQDNGAVQHRSIADVQRPLPLGPGFGYHVQATRSQQSTPGTSDAGATSSTQYGGLALAQYQGRYGFLEASHQQNGSSGSTSLTAAAGLVAMGGGVHLTRPVLDAFALVRVPGVKGVRGYLNNQDMGATNADGDLLVSNLLSYFGNRVGIGESDLPLDYTLGATERLVGPPFRGGAIVTFPATRVQGLVGTVAVERAGRTDVPVYGELTIAAAGQAFRSPIGRDGEVYFENVPPGRHPATIESRGATCAFDVSVPDTPASLVELGALVCARR